MSRAPARLTKQGPRLGIEGWADEDGTLDQFGVAQRQVDDELAAQRIAQQTGAGQVHGLHPGGEGIGQFRDIEDVRRVGTLAEAR